MHRDHPYLRAHERWKSYTRWWFSYCKPRLKPSPYSQEGAYITLSTDIAPSSSRVRQTKRPNLDWYDKFYDGYGSYDKIKNMIDHMETI
tara:strand:+ start:369 stop:635 length:267 start_codon:yes stop_codon:yes gene_type:complete